MNWKTGDIAICVKVGKLDNKEGVAPSLRLNAEYVVQNIYQCPKCKRTALDVGLGSNSKKGTSCCTERIPCKEIHWCGSQRFVKKDLKSKEEKIAEAIEKEDYELAEELKNL